jgi:monoamine oxidase
MLDSSYRLPVRVRSVSRLDRWKTSFEPVGRLLFAGERAVPIQGFVESGQRSAGNDTLL